MEISSHPIGVGEGPSIARTTVARSKAIPGTMLGNPSLLERGFAIGSLVVYSGGVLALVRRERGLTFDPNPEQADSLSQLVFLAIYAVTLLLLLRTGPRVIDTARRDGILWLVLALSISSVLWSSAPEITVRRSVGLIGTTLFGLYIASRFSLRDQLRLLAIAFAVAIGLSLIFVLALPGYGLDVGEAWRGIYSTKNAFGRIMALATMVYLLQAMRATARWPSLALLAGSFTLILFSSSRTSLVVALAMLALMALARSLRWHPSLAVPFLAVVMFVAVLATVWAARHTGEILDSFGRDVTFSGRQLLWDLVTLEIENRPWLGHGYGGFWLGWNGPSYYVWFITGWNPPHAHNGFLDLALDLGLIGLVLFSICLLRSLVRAVLYARNSRTPSGLWPLSYLLFMVLYNATESTILRTNSVFWLLFVAVVLSVRPESAGDLQEPEAGSA